MLTTFTLFTTSTVMAKERPVDLVYPHLDTANSRWFFFDSASRPFGMVNLNPDTEIGGAWGSGYRYHSDTIKGFSHVHAWQLSGLSVMPVVSSLPTSELKGDYYSPFNHDTEEVRPGYHKVLLERSNIGVELTATTRVGFHKYTFPAGKTPKILFKLSGKLGPVEFTDAHLEQIDAHRFSGYVTNGATIRRPKETPVFFHVELNQPVAYLSAWKGENVVEQAEKVSGRNTGAVLTLEKTNKPVMMKVGISYTSAENARKNLETELAHWEFDRTVKDATEEWNRWLSKITVTGGSLKQRRRFYTDLWHALQGRRIISDVDGHYSDQTGDKRVVKQLPKKKNGDRFNHYNSDSFWGAQWTISTLWPLAYPRVASDFSHSLLQYYRDGGMIPRGPSGGNYTYVMTGASSTPFMVSNWMKGIRDIDIDEVYTGLKRNHSIDGIMARAGYEHYSTVGGGMKYYLERGYIPYPIPEEADHSNGDLFHWKGAGQTIEYSFQDNALSQLAKSLGHDDDAAYFFERSRNYRNLYDASSGFMRPKELDGSWRKNYDPYDYDKGFVESNASQMTWFATHDLDGLAELMGGKQALVDKLDNAFKEASKQSFTAGSAHKYEKDKRYSRVPINYGNQPSMQTAFIFSAAGAPWKTQYWSREVVNHVFSGLSPDTGYNGDEDQGLMGSLAVLMKIGLFQLTGGTEPDPVYWIGSPLFDEISIELDSQYYPGNRFTIKTVNNSDKNRYVLSLRLNGKPLSRTYLRHSEIIRGGELILNMGPEPHNGTELSGTPL
ncbi:GH92 family glycosyl hydrolase [Microbulbifer sp.]|uniref:GH92 family glycosyl hydrolase n=1 Tax=Microbulbifer sp. TaxID=1908541 RepID=UPI003F674CFB